MNYLCDLYMKSPIVVWEFGKSADLPIRNVSSNIEVLWGYTVEEVEDPGFSFFNLVHPEDLLMNKDKVVNWMTSEDDRFFMLPYRIVSKLGNSVWVDEMVCKQRDEDGEVIGFVSFMRELAQDNQEDLSGVNKIAAAANQSNKPTIITDVEGNIEYVNSSFVELTGYDYNELVGNNPRILKSGLTLKSNYKNMWNTILAKKIWKGELCNKKKNGTLFWDKTTITPIIGIDGKIHHFLGVKEDITYLWETRQALHRKDILLQATAEVGRMLLTERPVDSLIQEALTWIGKLVDRDRVYVFEFHKKKEEDELLVSQRYEWAKDGVSVQINNPMLQNIVAMDLIPRWVEELSEGIHIRGNVRDFPPREKEVLESQQIVSLLVVPILIDSKCWGFVGFDDCVRDDNWSDGEIAVLESLASSLGMAIIKWRSKQELIQAKEKAEESDRLKTSFLQNISHEIRTPINGILGFVDLLLTDEMSREKELEYLGIVKMSGVRLLSTVNDLISLSKIGAGMITPNYEEVDVEHLLNELYDFFLPEVKKYGLHLVLHNDRSDERFVIGSDQEKLYAILVNLVKNAIKYSIQGTIEVGYLRLPSGVEFFVRDQGIGVPEEKINHIFERFMQVDQTASRSHEGAGLGLSIVKGYVDMLNGRIEVESQLNVGSLFKIFIPDVPLSENTEPLAEKSIKPPTKENAEEFVNAGGEKHPKVVSPLSANADVKVLVVEDDEINTYYMKMLLRDYGFNLLFAKNGVEAVRVFEQNRDVRLILMDIKMPEMDGYEATRRIRELDKTVPIIAQTAFSMGTDCEQTAEAGCTDFLSKPISKQDIEGVLEKYI